MHILLVSVEKVTLFVVGFDMQNVSYLYKCSIRHKLCRIQFLCRMKPTTPDNQITTPDFKSNASVCKVLV